MIINISNTAEPCTCVYLGGYVLKLVSPAFLSNLFMHKCRLQNPVIYYLQEREDREEHARMN